MEAELDIESLSHDFNAGKVGYSAEKVWIFNDGDGNWYADNPEDLMNNFGVSMDQLHFGYFFKVTG